MFDNNPFGSGSIKVWASMSGTNDQGDSLDLDKDDLIFKKIKFDADDVEGVKSSQAGAAVYYEVQNSIIRFEGVGDWNDVKSFKIRGRSDDLMDQKLELYNFVHTDVNFKHGQSNDGVDMMVDGAKRGNIRLTDHDDNVTVGVSSNNDSWNNHFLIKTFDGDDEVHVRSAIDEYLFNGNPNTVTGEWTTTKINVGEGNDLVDTSSVQTIDHIVLKDGDDVARAGGGDDRVYGHDGDDVMHGGRGDDDLYGHDGADTLIGGYGNDELRGGADNDLLIGDHDVTNPPELQHLDFTAAGSLEAVKTLLAEHDIVIRARNIEKDIGVNGDEDRLTDLDEDYLGYSHGGIGAAGESTPRPSIDEETGYDPVTGLSEKIEIDFPTDVTEVEFNFSYFFDETHGADFDFNEVMQIKLFRNGEELFGFDFSAENSSTDGVLNIGIIFDDMEGGFDRIELTALEYNNTPGNEGIEVDSSDFLLTGISYRQSDAAVGDDHIHAGSGDDDIVGGAGDDYIDGGSGHDKVYYQGNQNEYQITYNEDNTITIHDTVPDRDGEDTLKNVEWAAFADGMVDLTQDPPDNTAPMGNDDLRTGEIKEDEVVGIGGNVINAVSTGEQSDTDPDGDILSITGIKLPGDAGFETVGVGETAVIVGQYGTLTIGSDGKYSYSLDNNSAIVQSLSEGETVYDEFTYQLSDGQLTDDNTLLQIEITGTNDAPVLSIPIADQTINQDTAPGTVIFTLPEDTFTDIDTNDQLTLEAMVLRESTGDPIPVPLPSWISFNSETGEFTIEDDLLFDGEVTIRVTASDQYSSVSDDFVLTIEPPAPEDPMAALIKTAEVDDTIGSSSVEALLSRVGIDSSSLYQQLDDGEVLMVKVTGVDSANWYVADPGGNTIPLNPANPATDLKGNPVANNAYLSMTSLLVYADQTATGATFDDIVFDIVKGTVDDQGVFTEVATLASTPVGLEDGFAQLDHHRVYNTVLDIAPGTLADDLTKTSTLSIGDINTVEWVLEGPQGSPLLIDGSLFATTNQDLSTGRSDTTHLIGDVNNFSFTIKGGAYVNADLRASSVSVQDSNVTFGGDILNGGNAHDFLVGDVNTFSWKLEGGDVLSADPTDDNYSVGALNNRFSFGKDIISGAGANDLIVGDVNSLSIELQGTSDVDLNNGIIYGQAIEEIYVPDPTFLTGGDLLSGDEGDDIVIGDVNTLNFGLSGGDNLSISTTVGTGGLSTDYLIDTLAQMVGESETFFQFGNDFIQGGDGKDLLIGDVNAFHFGVKGGDNLSISTDIASTIPIGIDEFYQIKSNVGWLGSMDLVRFGEDSLNGGAGSDILIGDAAIMKWAIEGGNNLSLDVEADPNLETPVFIEARIDGKVTLNGAGVQFATDTLEGEAGDDLIIGDIDDFSIDVKGGDGATADVDPFDTPSSPEVLTATVVPEQPVGSLTSQAIFNSDEINFARDVLQGGEGNDTMVGDARTFSARAQAGNIASVTGSARAFAYASISALDVQFGFDNMVGGSGDDTMTGDVENLILQVKGGASFLSGNINSFQAVDGIAHPTFTFGDDFMEGGSGHDTLTGDVDTLSLMVEGGDNFTVDNGGAQESQISIDQMRLFFGNDTMFGDTGILAIAENALTPLPEGDDDILIGDVKDLNINLRNGNGHTVSNVSQGIYAASISGGFVAFGHDNLFAGAGSDTLVGDVRTININVESGSSITGTDAIYLSQSLSYNSNLVFGDDSIRADENFQNALAASTQEPLVEEHDDTLYGDIEDLNFAVTAGSDIVGGNHEINVSARLSFGQDFLSAGVGNDTLYGDARAVVFSLAGGSDINVESYGYLSDQNGFFFGGDTLEGGDGNDILYGDLQDLSILRTPSENLVSNVLKADAQIRNANIAFRQDTLNGGNGDDNLTGDVGTIKLATSEAGDVSDYTLQGNYVILNGEMIRIDDVDTVGNLHDAIAALHTYGEADVPPGPEITELETEAIDVGVNVNVMNFAQDIFVFDLLTEKTNEINDFGNDTIHDFRTASLNIDGGGSGPVGPAFEAASLTEAVDTPEESLRVSPDILMFSFAHNNQFDQAFQLNNFVIPPDGLSVDNMISGITPGDVVTDTVINFGTGASITLKGNDFGGLDPQTLSDGLFTDALTAAGYKLGLEGSGIGEILRGNEGDDLILGHGGDDTIDAFGGDDSIEGGDGNDTITATGGNNRILTGAGDNVVTTGDGIDRITTTRELELSGNNIINTGGGDDRVNTGDGIDIVNLGDGDDSVSTAGGDDTIDGGAGNDFISGQQGNDLIDGGDGDDLIFAGDDNDYIDGGADNDIINGEYGDDIIDGGFGDDTINGGFGDDIIGGGFGDDTIDGGPGDNTINGNEGNDTINGGEGNDTINGGIGDDNIVSGGGNDTVDGGDGNDFILVFSGSDVINGGMGDDTIDGGFGNDTIDGGEGVDELHYTGNRSDYEITVDTENSRYIIQHQSGGIGTEGIDNVGFDVEFAVFADVTLELNPAIDLNDVTPEVTLRDHDGTTVEGIDNQDHNGYSVSLIGDFNGDGFDDFVVGARWGDGYVGGNPDVTQTGEVYVIFGRAEDFDPTIEAQNLGTENNEDGFILYGLTSTSNNNDQFGFSVSSAGDVNGDGFDDMIVGTLGNQSFLIYGQGGSFDAEYNTSALNTTDGFRGMVLNGASSNDSAGRDVSAAGDVNGDGYDDILIGAHQADPNGSSSGEGYIVFGSDSLGESMDLVDINGTNGVVIEGELANDQAGYSINSAGDFNGDGLDDVIIGARFADAPTDDEGKSYIIYGRENYTNPIELDSLLPSQGLVLEGIGINDRSGTSVASAGDVNGDGLDDVIIGAIGPGEAYVVFGSNDEFSSAVDLAALDGSDGFKIEGNGGSFGNSVSGLGDINGDGYDDMIVGAFNEAGIGRSYIVFGAESFDPSIDVNGFNDGDGDDGKNGIVLFGGAGADRSGWVVSSAGDVNGDGFDDILIGDFSGDGNVGIAHLVYGGTHFNGQATQLGTEADDNLVGTVGADVIISDLGNDTVNTMGGIDTVYAGHGDDTIIVSDDTFMRVDGGSGEDTLVWDSAQDLDLGAIDHKLQDIEVIDTGDGDDTIDMAAEQDISENQDMSETVQIYILDDVEVVRSGDGNDTIIINDKTSVHIDGGLGDNDTLVWDGDDILYLGDLVDNLDGIERIDLGTGMDTPRFLDIFDVTDVLNASDTSDTLYVDGDANDRLFLNEGESAWQSQGSTEVGYTLYTYAGNENAMLQVAETIDVVGPN